MKDLSRFGTSDCPLHPSGLRGLLVCPWRSVMDYIATQHDDESGPAADTGSAVHRAAEAFHNGKEVGDSLKIMQADSRRYPRADLDEARTMFLMYSADSRNQGVRCLLVEGAIAFDIAPSPLDPTQAPIAVIGTVDQVREEDGRAFVWDIKTSKRDGLELLQESACQAAAYCIGASVKLGRKVEPGGIILTRKYKPSDVHRSPVFWKFTWTWDDIPQILDGVRHQVALIRMGHVYHSPNQDCRWCAAKTPDYCLPQLQELKRVQTP